MNMRNSILLVALSGSLACSSVTRLFTTSTAAPELPAPSYIPVECQNLPLATVPAATALALPTPVLQANPEIGLELQEQIFEQVVDIVEQVYVYPDYNGKDWEEIKGVYREKISSELSTQDFYTSIQDMISELGDEHSFFLSPVEVADSEAEFAGTQEFVGIGVFALPLEAKNRISLISVYPDSPAEHAGLKPHDSILAVDGIPVVQNGEALLRLVRGPQCSVTVLTVQSPNQETRTVSLVRQRIQSPQLVQAEMLQTADGSKVGYISLPTFSDETIPVQVADVLNGFGQLDGLILDNRMNGGGDSRVVEPILSYFTSGTLGDFTPRAESYPLTVEPDPIRNSQSVPLVILVGRETASFAEIFSGVLKDSSRAQIVGEVTPGNVEILQGYDFDDGSKLWLAAQTFVPAISGQDWEQTGIIPDVQAYADWDTFTFEDDPSIAAALKLLGH
ncbi:MAG: PDZ domain-containing protein [Chloroflexi bacterium]|nr:PDZ domain-containing protein [Chloroflexota bacterium]